MLEKRHNRLKEWYQATKVNHKLKRQLSELSSEHDKLKRIVLGLDIDHLVEILGDDYEQVVSNIKHDMGTIPMSARKTLQEYLNLHKVGLLHQYSQSTGDKNIEWHKIGAMTVIHNLLKIIGVIEKPRVKRDPITRERLQ